MVLNLNTLKMHLERKLHFVFVLFVLFFTQQVKAQIFSFEDTSTVIIKTTNQSPAHWYLEITNEIGTDSTLRWVTHFENIPVEWEINFDCQNQNWPVVLDGDSSDFVMGVYPDFPQKLIIGAVLNNTPGHGVIYFDIFDPANRSEMQTISYEYIVGIAGLNALEELPWLELKNDKIIITDNIPTRIEIFDLNGKLIAEELTSCDFQLDKTNVQLIRFTREGRIYQIKLGF